MKNQITITRVENGLRVDGPSLKAPIVFEELHALLTWVRHEVNYLQDTSEIPFKIVEKSEPEGQE